MYFFILTLILPVYLPVINNTNRKVILYIMNININNNTKVDKLKNSINFRDKSFIERYLDNIEKKPLIIYENNASLHKKPNSNFHTFQNNTSVKEYKSENSFLLHLQVKRQNNGPYDHMNFCCPPMQSPFNNGTFLEPLKRLRIIEDKKITKQSENNDGFGSEGNLTQEIKKLNKQQKERNKAERIQEKNNQYYKHLNAYINSYIKDLYEFIKSCNNDSNNHKEKTDSTNYEYFYSENISINLNKPIHSIIDAAEKIKYNIMLIQEYCENNNVHIENLPLYYLMYPFQFFIIKARSIYYWDINTLNNYNYNYPCKLIKLFSDINPKGKHFRNLYHSLYYLISCFNKRINEIEKNIINDYDLGFSILSDTRYPCGFQSLIYILVAPKNFNSNYGVPNPCFCFNYSVPRKINNPYVLFDTDILSMLSFNSYKQDLFKKAYNVIENHTWSLYDFSFHCYIYRENIICITQNNIKHFNYGFLNIIDGAIKNKKIKIMHISSLLSNLKKIYNYIYHKSFEYGQDIPNIFGKNIFTHEETFICYIDSRYSYFFQNNMLLKMSENLSSDFFYPESVIIQNDLNFSAKPSKNLLFILKIMTNDNFNNMNNLIRVLVNYCTATDNDKNGYLLINCSEKMYNIYKTFFSKIKINTIDEYENTAMLSSTENIPRLLENRLNKKGPIFVNEITEISNSSNSTYFNRFKKLLNGKTISQSPENTLSDNSLYDGFNIMEYFKYCIYKFKNNTPILMKCNDQKSINYMERNFRNLYYVFNFESSQITDTDYNSCLEKIENLSTGDISYIMYKMVSYGLYYLGKEQNTATADKTDNKNVIKENSVYSEEDIVKEFINKCCIVKENEKIKTEHLYSAYEIYNKENRERKVADSLSNSIYKIFYKTINIKNEKMLNKKNPKRDSKGKVLIIKETRINGKRGYKNIGLNKVYKNKVEEYIKATAANETEKDS